MTKLRWIHLMVFAVAAAFLPWAAPCEASSASSSGKSAQGRIINKADCAPERLGTMIPVKSIGEPVSAVTLSKPVWTDAIFNSQAYCSIDGRMEPIDKSATAKPINFRVVLPASWNFRAVQMGGAGTNGVIPNLKGGGPGMGSADWLVGAATYGSDSGHSTGSDQWTLNDEAIRNLGYMQIKKTHDAAMVLIRRAYGKKPRYSYFVGSSQGGREGLTAAQRYPKDYNGISATVPIVNFSTLMLAPALMRIQEKPLANWVPATKAKAVAWEFIRQCDNLDGLKDGVINNYAACRRIFNVHQGDANRNPWKERRCPNSIDPNPDDTSMNACFTDGQSETLKFIFSSYMFHTPLANGVKSFGMWAPNTEPGSGFGAPSGAKPPAMPGPGAAGGVKPAGMPDMSGASLLVSKRYKGQENAGAEAPMHSHMGGMGVTGMLFQDLSGNPLDYAEGGKYDARRLKISEWLDSTNPNLRAFYKRGGKVIIAIGTNDSIASSGAQLDYYQSLIDTMGQPILDTFARLYVIPQGNHGLSGASFPVDADGQPVKNTEIPNVFDRFSLLSNWVEHGGAPAKSIVVTNRSGGSGLMCSYPAYPKYMSGETDKAGSYTCTSPD